MLPCDELPYRRNGRIRVLVVDDHAAVRHAMATFIRYLDDMEVAGEAASGDQALCLCASSRPDVVLMAIAMPGMSAAETTRTIRERWPSIRVVGMSTFQEEEHMPEVLQAGAVRCLLKNLSGEELAGAIRRAYAA